MLAPMLTVSDLHAGHGQGRVLHGVDLQVGEGEIVGLLGRNGSGRSTLLKTIIGQLAGSGSIMFRGEPVLGLPAFEIARRGIGYVPENRSVFPTLTVAQNLLLGEKPGRSARARPSRWSLADMYSMFPPLKARAHTAAGVLSGGEQQMLAICRTLMGDPDLVMVDEPTEGLAPQRVAQVAEVLTTLKARGVSVLLVEQKLAVVLQIADRCCVMGHGRIVFDGSVAALSSDASIRRDWLAV